jgi:hypothetical protein
LFFTRVRDKLSKKKYLLFPTFQDAFDELYIGSSSREKGTLFYIKNYFNHRNVTNNVKEAFNYVEEFLQFCTDSYIVLAGMHCMDIAEINETPDDFPLTKDEKLRYLHHISSLIVDMLYISSQPMVQKILQTEEPSNETYPICICKEDIAGADMIFCNAPCRADNKRWPIRKYFGWCFCMYCNMSNFQYRMILFPSFSLIASCRTRWFSPRHITNKA